MNQVQPSLQALSILPSSQICWNLLDAPHKAEASGMANPFIHDTSLLREISMLDFAKCFKRFRETDLWRFRVTEADQKSQCT
ncbi:MAG: hypothetical protein IKH77_03920 [Clostridia bacterium]|nr:hypothetical protein [Clostridia bacterium]